MLGAKRSLVKRSPVRSRWNFREKLRVSQMVRLLALEEMFARYFPSGEKSRLK